MRLLVFLLIVSGVILVVAATKLRTIWQRRQVHTRDATDWNWEKWAFNFKIYRQERSENFCGCGDLIEYVNDWALGANKAQNLLITAAYGEGKSALLAHLVNTWEGKEVQDTAVPTVAAEHFCSWQQRDTLSPGRFVRSLAAQLALRVELDEFRQALNDDRDDLIRRLADADAEPREAFHAMVTQLFNIHWTNNPNKRVLVVVVDALDDALEWTEGRTNETILSLLAQHPLPSWLKLLTSTRREIIGQEMSDTAGRNIQEFFRGCLELSMDGDNRRNEKQRDLRDYARSRAATMRNNQLKRVVEQVAQSLSTSEKIVNFLLVKRILNDVEAKRLTIESVDQLNNLSFDVFYQGAFNRAFSKPGTDYTRTRQFLALLIQQRAPLSYRELDEILNDNNGLVAKHALRPVMQYLRRTENRCNTMSLKIDHDRLRIWLKKKRRPAALMTKIFASCTKKAQEFDYSIDQDILKTAAIKIFDWCSRKATDRETKWMDEAYLTGNLIWHQTNAPPGRHGIRDVPMSFQWLEARLCDVKGDILRIITEDIPQMPSQSFARKLKKALEKSQNVLSFDSTQLASQLLLRLPQNDTDLHEIRDQAMRSLRSVRYGSGYGPGFRPLCPSLKHDVRSMSGHCDAVLSLAWLSDDILATGSADRTIRVWRYQDSRCIAILVGHTGAILSLMGLEDDVLASGSDDGTIRLWKIPRRNGRDDPEQVIQKPYHTLKCASIGGAVSSLLRVGGDQRELLAACGYADNVLRVWDLDDPKHRAFDRCVGHTAHVGTLALLKDGRLASGSYDGTIRLWSRELTSDGNESERIEVIQDTEMPMGRVNCVLALNDFGCDREPILASASTDEQSLRLWKQKPDAGMHTLIFRQVPRLGNHGDWVRSLAQVDYNCLASASDDRTVKLWHWRGDTLELHRNINAHSDWIRTLLAYPEANGRGRRLASGSEDRLTRIWTSDNWIDKPFAELPGHGMPVWSLAILDRNTVALASGFSVALFDVRTDTNVPRKFGSEHGSRVKCVKVLDEKTKSLLVGSDDGTINLWNWEERRYRSSFGDRDTCTCHTGPIWALEVLSNNQFASGSVDRTVRVWNVDNPDAPLETFTDPRDSVTSLTRLKVSGQDMLAAGSDDGYIYFWNLKSLQFSNAFDTASVWLGKKSAVSSLVAIEDDLIVCATDYGDVCVWNICTQAHTKKNNDPPGAIYALAVLPDKRVAVGSDDGTVRVWDWENKKSYRIFVGDFRITAIIVCPSEPVLVCVDAAEQVHRLDFGQRPHLR